MVVIGSPVRPAIEIVHREPRILAIVAGLPDGHPIADAVIVRLMPSEAAFVHRELEAPNWAPWLRYSPREIARQSAVFPLGQLVMKSASGRYVASLSANRFQWDGDPGTLPTWDSLAGSRRDYRETFQPDGNALVLMSMNVAPAFKGLACPSIMLDVVAQMARVQGITALLGPFRPSGFGQAKRQLGHRLDLWTYCRMKQPGGERPLDPWLRTLSWCGMRLLRVCQAAMTVTRCRRELDALRLTHRPDLWREVEPGRWECGEVGTWTVTGNRASYVEDNVWGELPLSQPEHPG